MKGQGIALVTEAGNNLGMEFAKILSQEGYKVVLAADAASLLKFKTQANKDIHLFEIDYDHPISFQQLQKQLSLNYGKLDILINNAEIANGFGQKIKDLDMDALKALYQQNLFSIIELTKTLYPLLLKSEKAKIVNISSALGQIEKMKDDGFCYAQYQMTGFITAKAALEMFTITLNRELSATNIKAMSFDPVRPKNSTHDHLFLCSEVKRELLTLLKDNPTQLA